MSSIYVTGDIHGNPARLSSDTFPAGKKLNKDDVVEILGDFGLIWEQEESPTEEFHLDWLNKKPWTTVATLGNHENYDRIATLPVEEHFGGPVWVVRPSVFLLQSGYVYTICGKKIWNFNGAQSHDISDGILDPEDPQFANRLLEMRMNFKNLWRIKNVTWWEQEIEQDPEVYERGIKNLEEAGDDLDFVWTHCCSRNTAAMMGFTENDKLVKYFNKVEGRIPDKTRWYFGHYHRDALVSRHHECVYQKIFRIA